MTRSEKNAIADIIRIYPLIYGLQDKIDEETERLVDDMSMPTRTLIDRLKSIENRRIDLCNLKVLYGIIERGLKDEFGVFKLCAERHIDCTLFSRAEKCIKSVGYDGKRVIREFKYLFATLGRPKKTEEAIDYSSGGAVAVTLPA